MYAILCGKIIREMKHLLTSWQTLKHNLNNNCSGLAYCIHTYITYINILQNQNKQAYFCRLLYRHTINTCADRHKLRYPKNNSPFSPTELCLFLSRSQVCPSPPDFTLEGSVPSAPGQFTALETLRSNISVSPCGPIMKLLLDSSLWNNKCIYGWLSAGANGDLILKMAFLN